MGSWGRPWDAGGRGKVTLQRLREEGWEPSNLRFLSFDPEGCCIDEESEFSRQRMSTTQSRYIKHTICT